MLEKQFLDFVVTFLGVAARGIFVDGGDVYAHILDALVSVAVAISVESLRDFGHGVAFVFKHDVKILLGT